MTIRLRPHHLLCMLTYVGKGYSAAFVDNYDRIAARLSAGEDMLIVEGPDDICGPVADTDGSHCRTESVSARDAQAAADAGALLGQTIRPGLALSLTGTQIEALRSAFRTGHIRPACAGCEWSALCTQIADGGYRDVRINVQASGSLSGAGTEKIHPRPADAAT